MKERARRLAGLTVAVVVLASCSGGSDESARARVATHGSREAVSTGGSGGIGIVRAGSTAQFADCTDWMRGTPEARRVTIRSIRDQLTPQESETAESPLSDERAYRIFDKTCSSGAADSQRLYKLYARAQTFAAFAEAIRSGS